MSATNKQNAAKKKLHHHTGSGGYLVARPKWSKTENDLVDKGIEPETINWPDRCRTWFFGVGGTLDPVSGECVWTEEQLRIPVRKLQHYIAAAQEGAFIPDKENDELTMALGNPEHPGRTRGTPGSIPWQVGIPDAGGYKSHERRKKVQQTQMQALQARVDPNPMRGTRSKSWQTYCRSLPRSYPAISAQKQRGFHRAASAGACLDGSCQLSRGCYHGVSKLPPYDAMDEFEGQGGCWLCLSY